MLCLQLLTGLLNTLSVTPVRGARREEEKLHVCQRVCSETTVHLKNEHMDEDSYQPSPYGVRNKRRPACLSERLILVEVSEVFPLIRL